MTTTSDTPQVLLVYEGQQHWIPADLATQPHLLKQLLAAVSPELANADLTQSEGKIEVVARKGTKGKPDTQYCQILEQLRSAPAGIDPAILAAAALKKLETLHGLNAAQARLRYGQITSALEAAAHWKRCYDATLARAQQVEGTSHVVVGF